MNDVGIVLLYTIMSHSREGVNPVCLVWIPSTISWPFDFAKNKRRNEVYN